MNERRALYACAVIGKIIVDTIKLTRARKRWVSARVIICRWIQHLGFVEKLSVQYELQYKSKKYRESKRELLKFVHVYYKIKSHKSRLGEHKRNHEEKLGVAKLAGV